MAASLLSTLGMLFGQRLRINNISECHATSQLPLAGTLDHKILGFKTLGIGLTSLKFYINFQSTAYL